MDTPFCDNSANYAEDDFDNRYKIKYLKNQINYGQIEQLNVDKACTVESVIELGLAGPNKISKSIMQLHLDDIKSKFADEMFCETANPDDDSVSMLQISREEDYAQPENARQMHLYLFGYNQIKDETTTIKARIKRNSVLMQSNRITNPLKYLKSIEDEA